MADEVNIISPLLVFLIVVYTLVVILLTLGTNAVVKRFNGRSSAKAQSPLYDIVSGADLGRRPRRQLFLITSRTND